MDELLKIIKNLNTSCYLIGSLLRDDYFEHSDIDVIICNDAIKKEDFEKIILEKLSSFSNFHKLSVKFLHIPTLKHLPYELKTRKLVTGKDVLVNFAHEPFADYFIRVTKAACTTIGLFHAKNDKNELEFPLQYSVNEKYYGYFSENEPNNVYKKSLRYFCSLNLDIARFFLAYKKQLMSATKKETLTLHTKYLQDEWSEHISKVYALCHDQLQYQIPTDTPTQSHLKKLCRKTLVFENFFLLALRELLESNPYQIPQDQLNLVQDK